MNVKKTKSSKKIVLKITMSMTEPLFHEDGEDRPYHILRRGEVSDDQRGTASTNASSCERRSNRL